MIRFRFWLWWHLCKLPHICPANSYSRIIQHCKDQNPRIDHICREDVAHCGTCWCGKIRLHDTDEQTKVRTA